MVRTAHPACDSIEETGGGSIGIGVQRVGREQVGKVAGGVVVILAGAVHAGFDDQAVELVVLKGASVDPIGIFVDLREVTHLVVSVHAVDKAGRTFAQFKA
ncbi:hypothetical protein D3C71_1786550 [compost metagenome]